MKKLLYLVLLIILTIPSFAEDKPKSGNFDLRIGISDMGEFLNYRNVYGVYNLNIEYRASKYLSGGVQLGYGAYKSYNSITGKNTIRAHIFMYNLSACVYLTPLFNKKPEPKADFYLKGKIGAYSLSPLENYVYLSRETRFDYGGYVGVEYNPLKRLGIFAEVGYGEITFSQVGLSLKFGK